MKKDFAIPPSLWERIVEFAVPGRHGRVELDVRDGKFVGGRLIESIRPDPEELEEKECGKVA